MQEIVSGNQLIVAFVISAAILLIGIYTLNSFSVRLSHVYIEERKEFFILVGSIFAVGYTLYEYNDVKLKARIEKSLEFVKEYRSSYDSVHRPRIEYARKLMINLSKCKENLGLTEVCKNIAADKEGKVVGSYIFDRLLVMADGSIDSDGIDEESKEVLRSIVLGGSFFNELSACVIQGICDVDVACDNMVFNVHTFNLNFQGFFDRYTQVWHDDPTSNIDIFLDQECQINSRFATLRK